MLLKVIAHREQVQIQLLLLLRIVLRVLAHLDDRVAREQGVGVAVADAAEVVLGDGVDDGLVLLDALLAVQVQDRLVGLAVVDAREAVVQAADVDEAAGDPHAAPRVAQVRGVGGEQDPPDAEGRRAPLVHLVRRHAHQLVVARPRVARQHQLVLPGLSLLHLLPGQAGGLAVRDAVHAVFCDSGRHLFLIPRDRSVSCFASHQSGRGKKKKKKKKRIEGAESGWSVWLGLGLTKKLSGCMMKLESL